MGGDFFDDFGKGEGLFTSEEEHARIRELLVDGGGGGGDGGDGATATATTTAASASSSSSLQARFCALLTEMAAGKYASLEEARAAHPLDPYLRAAGDAAALESMRAEAAAAAKCAEQQQQQQQAEGGEGGGAKGTWEPPPEDEEPETAQDYE